MNSKTESPTASVKSQSSFWLLLVLLFVFAALCLYDSSSSKYAFADRTWGFDHLLFFGTAGKIIFLLFALLLLVPYSNRWFVKGMQGTAEWLSGFRRKKILLFLLISLVSVVFFYLFRVKYYFLGDLNIRLIQVMKKEFLATEYLTMRLLYLFASAGTKFGLTADQSFKLYSCLCGALFVLISCLIADLLGRSSFQKVMLFLSQISTALLLIFCGYVEIYATPIVLLSLYFYVGLRYMQQRNGIILPLLCLSVAVFSHLLCLAAIPSLAVIYYFRNREKLSFISKRSNRSIALWLFLLIFLSLMLALKVKSGFFLTVSAPPTAPKLLTLFSPRHFWELINGQLLCCGLSFVFIFSLLLRAVREKITLQAEHYFLLSVGGCFLLLLFMANLQRGSGDWDIMAFSAVSINLLVCLLIFHLHKKQLAFAHYLVTVLVGLNGMNALLWIQINHTDQSIAKIDSMLTNDPGTYYTMRISGTLQLAMTYKSNNLMTYSQQAALRACENNEMRGCVMYGLAIRDAGRTEEAEKFFENLLKTRSAYVYEAYIFLIEYETNKNDMEKLGYYLNLFLDSFVRNPNDFINDINFKAPFVSKLFEVLYTITPESDVQRRQLVRNVSESLKIFKRTGEE